MCFNNGYVNHRAPTLLKTSQVALAGGCHQLELRHSPPRARLRLCLLSLAPELLPSSMSSRDTGSAAGARQAPPFPAGSPASHLPPAQASPLRHPSRWFYFTLFLECLHAQHSLWHPLDPAAVSPYLMTWLTTRTVPVQPTGGGAIRVSLLQCKPSTVNPSLELLASTIVWIKSKSQS